MTTTTKTHEAHSYTTLSAAARSTAYRRAALGAASHESVSRTILAARAEARRALGASRLSSAQAHEVDAMVASCRAVMSGGGQGAATAVEATPSVNPAAATVEATPSVNPAALAVRDEHGEILRTLLAVALRVERMLGALLVILARGAGGALFSRTAELTERISSGTSAEGSASGPWTLRPELLSPAPAPSAPPALPPVVLYPVRALPPGRPS